MAEQEGRVADDNELHDTPPGSVQTGGGSYVAGGVTLEQGDFIGRDKIIYTEDLSYNVAGLPNPYLGLMAFQYQDRLAFGGRKRAVQEAVEKITRPGARQAVLFVTGASGSGKSSFALAGLLPELEAYYQARGKEVRWVVLRPSANPVAMLADAFQQIRLADISPSELQCLAPEAFWQFVRERTGPSQVNLLVIDQFEEVFTQSNQAEGQWLLDCLGCLHDFELTRSHVILTLRSDFLDKVFTFPPIWEMAKNALELRGMTQAEIREAIQQPLLAARDTPGYVGKRFEPLLLDTLAGDAGEDAAYLPLLQITLYRLWQNGRLAADRYHQLTDAISEHAELVYAWADYASSAPVKARTADERAALIDILLSLVRVSPDDDPRHDVRFRREKAEVENGSPVRAQIIADLISARLLSVSTAVSAGKTIEWIDIIHESLLNNWPRLRQAIADQRDTLRQRARFESYLAEWAGSDHSDGYLLAEIRLAEAEKLDSQKDVALNSPEAQAFLKRSMEKAASETQRQLALERKARQRTQALAGVLLLIALVAIGILSYPTLLSLFARGDMASIPAGPVTVGPDEYLGRAQQGFDHLDAFSIDRYEVTNARYRLCVKAKACSSPSNPLEILDTSRANYPVTGITAIQASEFCHWVGGRLPTEIEWERAARGAEGRTWPWGEADISPLLANIDFGDGAELKPVGSYPAGCTPEHICDLLGNASEITSSWTEDLNHYQIEQRSETLTKENITQLFAFYRGFDFITSADVSKTSSALFIVLYQPSDEVGFRCAR
jgi:formylglycine-generating enzyme required for sulfatase activity